MSANLPTPTTPLVGRDAELQRLTGLLRRDDVRLVTLTGPPGTGKTRLALAAGHALAADFSDGVFLVELASLADPALVRPTIAQTLGVMESGLQSLDELLPEHLSDKRLLIVVDNFEHLLDAGPVLSELLAAAPGLSVLATSRERLRLSAEHDFPLAPLTEDDAVELFATLASAAQPSFRVDGDRAVVAKICRQLDCLPLALELAAVRVKVLPPASLLARLEQRLPLLTSGVRDAPERQRTMRATIEWSYELLESTEQALLARLAVFAGGCTLEGAEEVAGADLETLSSLLDKSLLRHDDERFAMLDTIREFALGRLEASNAAEDVSVRHAEHFLACAERAEPELSGPQQAAWFETLETEHDNFRAALVWGLAHRPELALRLAAALWRFWHVRAYITEGRRWLEDALAAAPAGDPRARAKALSGASVIAQMQGRVPEARAFSEGSVALFRELGDMTETAFALNRLGNVEFRAENMERAAAHYEEALVLARDAGNEVAVSRMIGNLGAVALNLGDYPRASALCSESFEIKQRHDEREGMAISRINLGVAALLQSELDDAREFLGDGFERSLELGHRDYIAYCFVGFAMLAARRGDMVGAARTLGACHALLDETGLQLDPFEARLLAQSEAEVDSELGAEAAAFKDEGQQMSLVEAAHRALATTAKT